MPSSSSSMASRKALLVSAGAVSIAVAIRASVPSTSDPLATWLPPVLGSLHSWFRPPYLFVFFNCFIIAIAATSRCFHNSPPETIAPDTVAVAVAEEIEAVEAAPAAEAEAEAFDEFNHSGEKRVVVGNGGRSGGRDGYGGDCEEERKFAFGRSASTPRRRVDASEKARVPRRRVRRKAGDGDPLQGSKALRRSECGSNDSIENFWKVIAEAEPTMPVTRHVKIDDTYYQINLLEHEMQKSTTFKNRINQLRDELTRDELNLRVEAFLGKSKEKKRLELRQQRQKSMDQFYEMIGRGT